MSVKVHESLCLDSAQDHFFFGDHFLGDQLKDEWVSFGDVGNAVVVDGQTGGIVRITTGATSANDWAIYWNRIRILHVSKKVTLEIRAKVSHVANTNAELSLIFDSTNKIAFYYSAGDTQWHIFTRQNGPNTNLLSGVNIETTAFHIFRIEVHTHGSDHAHFYIDGAETSNSPISTTIPNDATDFFEPYCFMQTLENVAKTLDVDYVVVRQDR